MKKIKKVVAAVKKVGTLNLVLILVGAFFVWFNWQMILVFRECGSIHLLILPIRLFPS